MALSPQGDRNASFTCLPAWPAEVCDGRGVCVAQDVCECPADFTGYGDLVRFAPNCAIHVPTVRILYGIFSTFSIIVFLVSVIFVCNTRRKHFRFENRAHAASTLAYGLITTGFCFFMAIVGALRSYDPLYFIIGTEITVSICFSLGISCFYMSLPLVSYKFLMLQLKMSIHDAESTAMIRRLIRWAQHATIPFLVSLACFGALFPSYAILAPDEDTMYVLALMHFLILAIPLAFIAFVAMDKFLKPTVISIEKIVAQLEAIAGEDEATSSVAAGNNNNNNRNNSTRTIGNYSNIIPPSGGRGREMSRSDRELSNNSTDAGDFPPTNRPFRMPLEALPEGEGTSSHHHHHHHGMMRSGSSNLRPQGANSMTSGTPSAISPAQQIRRLRRVVHHFRLAVMHSRWTAILTGSASIIHGVWRCAQYYCSYTLPLIWLAGVGISSAFLFMFWTGPKQRVRSSPSPLQLRWNAVTTSCRSCCGRGSECTSARGEEEEAPVTELITNVTVVEVVGGRLGHGEVSAFSSSNGGVKG